MKSLIVSEENWKRLFILKMNKKLKNMDMVIESLLSGELQ